MVRAKKAREASGKGKQPKWLPPGTAATQLDIGTWKLADLRKRGVFRLGYHYRDIAPPNALRPTFQYHVQRCDALLTGEAEAIVSQSR